MCPRNVRKKDKNRFSDISVFLTEWIYALNQYEIECVQDITTNVNPTKPTKWVYAQSQYKIDVVQDIRGTTTTTVNLT